MVRVVLLLVAVLLVACDGNGSDPAPEMGAAVDAPDSGGSVEPTADEPTEPDDDILQDDDVRQEVADTVEGFLEAYLNGEVLKLATYWSVECSAEDIEAADGGSIFLAGFAGGEVDVVIDVDRYVIEQIGDNRVLIPGEQPAGAAEVLIDGRPLPDDSEDDPENEEDDDVVLVLEEGIWKVTDCEEYALDFS